MAGAKICSAVLSSSWFHKCSNIGIYIHCEKLNEVDTSAIVNEALAAGKSGTLTKNFLSIEYIILTAVGCVYERKELLHPHCGNFASRNGPSKDR